MKNRIVFVHGRARKPSEDNLRSLWYDAIRSGLERDFGRDAVNAFENTPKDFVYYGDLSNKFLKEEEEDPESRIQALNLLCQIGKNDFTKDKFEALSKLGCLKEALADTFSGVLGCLRLADDFISAVAPDIENYWNEEDYYGSDIRHRLLQVLRDALKKEERIMLIGHSLGSVICYDNLWKLSHYGEYREEFGDKKRVDLLVTMGSPLGDITVKRRLKGSKSKGKKRYPLNIKRWVNISAEDDYISHDSKLADDFKAMAGYGIIQEPVKDIYPVYNMTVRGGRSNPHASMGYLIHPGFIETLHSWIKEGALGS
ncbi:hypothetical protein [Persicobacter diffluens]|uniref:Alpha/beta hydrolase n=1 Tax=Persicobacter diffluens TaxID=981 RepID=A0AAN5APZ1_9BACT|nr:hypothetical protein PEDI_53480 [Persicobacter diffluens]